MATALIQTPKVQMARHSIWFQMVALQLAKLLRSFSGIISDTKVLGDNGPASPFVQFADLSAAKLAQKGRTRAKDVAKALVPFFMHSRMMSAKSFSVEKATAKTKAKVTATKAKVAARASAPPARASAESEIRSAPMARQ